MKSKTLVVMMATGLSLALTAQTNPPANMGANKPIPHQNLSVDQRAQRNSQKAAKDLGLNADQTSKWEMAAKERMTANQPIREKLMGSTTPEERKQLHQQSKAINDKFDAAVTGFLTPEQKTKWETIKKQKMDERRAHEKGKPQPEGGAMPPGLDD